MFLDHLTDEEIVTRLRMGDFGPVVEALLFRLERAIDGKHDAAALGQFGAAYSTPFPEAFDGKVTSP